MDEYNQVSSTNNKEIKSNFLRLFPNPNEGIVVIQGDWTSYITNLTLYNITGANVTPKTKIITNDLNITIDMRELNKGIFFKSR